MFFNNPPYIKKTYLTICVHGKTQYLHMKQYVPSGSLKTNVCRSMPCMTFVVLLGKNIGRFSLRQMMLVISSQEITQTEHSGTLSASIY